MLCWDRLFEVLCKREVEAHILTYLDDGKLKNFLDMIFSPPIKEEIACSMIVLKGCEDLIVSI